MDTTTAPPAPAPVELRAAPVAATLWGLLGAALLAAGLFFVVDSAGHPLAWLALMVFLVPAGFFIGQALVPSAVSVRLDRDALRARTFGWRAEVAWDAVDVVTLSRVGGDNVLVVEAWDGPRTQGRRRTLWIILPVGCDLLAVHRFLSRRLGTGGAASGSPHPTRTW